MYYINVFHHSVTTYGASQHNLSPIAIQALLDSNFKLLRYTPTTTPPFGYFDKSMYWLPSQGISSNDELNTFEKIKAEIDRLVEYGSAGMYFTHGICSDEYDKTSNGTGSTAQKFDVFKKMIDYLVKLRNEEKIQIVTMEDFYNML